MSGDTEREVLRSAIGGVLINASNFPPKVQFRVLGQDMRPLIQKVIDAILAEFMPEHDKRVRAEQRRAILIEVMMIPCWITGGRSEFDIPGESHRDTVLAAIREASDD